MVKEPQIDLKDRNGLTKNSRLFEAWHGDNFEHLNEAQVMCAGLVQASFDGIKLNLKNPNALEGVWQSHDQYVDRLLASLKENT